MKKLVIFDLDGTLLNSIADLAQSTNHALRANGFPEHEVEEYRFFVGNGINKLFERALPDGNKDEGHIQLIRRSFLEFYDKHKCDFTTPYPGIPELLHHLAEAGVKLAVASNKYDKATKELIAHFFGSALFSVVLGQREGVPTKPDPQIVSDILASCGFGKSDVLYVGDSGVDMMTARNAGVEACGVTWGFRPMEELRQYEPAHIANHPREIQSIVLN